MTNGPDLITPEARQELVEFAQRLVRTKSISGQEEEIVRLVAKQMKALGYDEVVIDGMGNVLGRIGRGEKAVMLNSHVDTVEVNDADKWAVPPFSGDLVDGRLYGRGAADMKSGAAAAIYAGALAKRLGLDAGKTIYVSGTVFEEDCDGENLKHLFRELNFRPGYVIICEPSSNRISLGHKGKAQISIKTRGVSAHGAAPEKGLNAIYEMADIIRRVEKTNAELMKQPAPRGTLAMTRISSTSASLNAVPSECEAYLDRRTAPGETEAAIRQEMDEIVRGKNAAWAVGTLHRTSWTGLEISYQPFHPAWKIGLEHELARACVTAYRDTFGRDPAEYDFWDFSTNAVTPVSLGIPTIGFGPGDSKLAHMHDEHCPVDQIVAACRFYVSAIRRL